MDRVIVSRLGEGKRIKPSQANARGTAQLQLRVKGIIQTLRAIAIMMTFELLQLPKYFSHEYACKQKLQNDRNNNPRIYHK